VQITDKPGAVAFPPLEHEIRLEHVTFGYDPGRPVLNDLSLIIPAGAEIAIVGPSGCGKSTVVNMILRFWDPGAGRVLFDDRDLRDGTVASLRKHIGIVFPETFIFNTSIRENIAIGYPEATDADVERAARTAQLDQFVRTLPAGYDTVLGERGVRMSSGQRQRLAIARALLRDPSVLILDEATSALDPQTESEILDTLATIGRGRTTISIRHRLAAVATADIIFVLDQGRLAEQGRHTELVKAGGLYQRLYEEQMLYLHGGGVVRVGVDVEHLRVIPLFEHLNTTALEAVAERFMLERYAADEIVVRQGDPGDKLYLISRGELDVLRKQDGQEQRINVLGRGDYFGEMALLTNEPRNATVRTQAPTQLYSLAADDFQALLDRLPDVREAVSLTAAGRRPLRSDAAPPSPEQ
jgi:ATP-binding cassette subfamily B protein